MSRRILLLLTGTCEQRGLGPALNRAFVGRADVEFVAHGEHLSFTSDEVRIDALAGTMPAATRGPVDKLAAALVEAGLGHRCDLAIAIDDLELVNADRAADVRAFFRAAVERELARIAPLTHAEVARIARLCSFHLLAPMVESYFFGERAAVHRALTTAGAAAGVAWTTSGATIEGFATSDPHYCDRVRSPDVPRSDRHGDKTLAWRAANRERHPKHYMEFLCRAAPLGYREGKAGVAALEKLAFPDVISAGAPLLEELLADIEDALGIPRVLGAGASTWAAGVLRNL